MSGHDWTEVVGAIGLFTLVITVITVILRHLTTTSRTKAALTREHEYRSLADAVLRVQENNERQLAAINDHIGQLQAKVTSLERILKEVE